MFFEKSAILLKKLKFQTAYFFSEFESLKKFSVTFKITKFRFFSYQNHSCSSKTEGVQFFRSCKIESFQESDFSAPYFLIIYGLYFRSIPPPTPFTHDAQL